MKMMSSARFLVVLIASLITMYLLSQSLIFRWSDFEILNLSNLYIALAMVSAMAVIMVIGMWNMFQPTARTLIAVLGIVILIASFYMGRASFLIRDTAFMQSMIPHHSRAVLMCEKSVLSRPEVKRLCGEIISSQEREITEMKALLRSK